MPSSRAAGGGMRRLMLRGEQQEGLGSGGGSRQQDCGMGAAACTPLTPGRKRRTGGLARLLGAAFLLGVFVTGAMVNFDMRADPAATADCTALLLDRDTGRTVAVPCAGTIPSLPGTLTALLPTGLPEDVAATR